MGVLPAGTVTLVLGDVEASADDMAAAMKSLHATIDALLAAHNGASPLEQGEGDSFVAAFGRARDAVAFAVALTARAELPVRIGIHTGDVEVVDGGYAGSTIIRAARIRDAGHGGQVLLSNATAALVADDVDLDDLGEHRLKGLTRSERVWQIPGDFPPLRLADRPALIPERLTKFVGRSVELAHVHDLLKERGCVTLTGAGGAGKTRLALELVAARGTSADAPTWFVDLAAVDDEANVPTAVADAVSAHSAPGRSPADSIAAIVRDRDALVVFDNCEHVLGACSELAADLLGRCANLTVLATSREPLGLAGEITYRVPSMSVDEATALFVERARRADPRLVLDDSNTSVIAEICARLDGMPLAIELAAARMRVFTVQQLLDVLHDRFRLLTGGARTALPRQRTLEASVDWSHALLLAAERTLLRRLSVFAGGFDLDAAVAVAAHGELEAHHVFDLLVQLVEKSLVSTDETAPGRFRLLETIRHYAMARLVDAGEADECRRLHYAHYLRLIRRDNDGGPRGELAHLKVLQREDANLRRAVQWAADQPGFETYAAIGLPVAYHLRHTRRATDAVAMMGDLNARTADAPPAVRVRVLTELASAINSSGSYGDSAAVARKALELSEELDDPKLRMFTLIDCHGVLANAEAVNLEMLEEAAAIARELGDERAEALANTMRGFFIMREYGNYAVGAPILREGVVLARKHGMARLEGTALGWLFMGGVLTEASTLDDFERAAALLEQTGQGFLLANLYAIAAIMQCSKGDDDACERTLVTLDTLVLEMNDVGARFLQAVGHGMVALLRGDPAAAAERLGVFARIPGAGVVQFLPFLALAEALTDRLDEADAIAARAAETAFDMNGLQRAAVALARAEIAHRRGDHAAAWEISIGAATSPDVTRSTITPMLVGTVGRSAFHLGRAEEAVRVMAARDQTGPLNATGLLGLMFDETLAQARAQLGDEAFDALWAEGATMSTDEALALVQRGRGSRQRPMLGWDSLTPTEADVARLVAQGIPNKDVAAQLFISEATVKTHLTRIYAKVGVKNRAQLAAAASERRPS